MYKSKAEVRIETENAIKKFLKQGGSIEVVKSQRTKDVDACQSYQTSIYWYLWFRCWFST